MKLALCKDSGGKSLALVMERQRLVLGRQLLKAWPVKLLKLSGNLTYFAQNGGVLHY